MPWRVCIASCISEILTTFVLVDYFNVVPGRSFVSRLISIQLMECRVFCLASFWTALAKVVKCHYPPIRVYLDCFLLCTSWTELYTSRSEFLPSSRYKGLTLLHLFNKNFSFLLSSLLFSSDPFLCFHVFVLTFLLHVYLESKCAMQCDWWASVLGGL